MNLYKNLTGPEVLDRMKGVVFDHDDTITSSYPFGLEYGGIHEMSRLAAIQRLGREIGHKALIQYPESLNNSSYNRAQEATFQAAVWVNLLDTGLVKSSDEYNPRHPYIERVVAYKNEVHPELVVRYAQEVPGAIRFCRIMHERGIQLAIASSAHRREIALSLRVIGLDDLFDCSENGNVVGYEDVPHGMHKPHPGHFLQARSKLSLDSSDDLVLAIDDHPGGIESAVSAGCFTYGVTSRKTADELRSTTVPPHRVGTYKELGQWLGLPGY